MNQLIHQPKPQLFDADTADPYAFPIDELQQRRQERQQRKTLLEDFLHAIYADEYGDMEKERWSLLWDEQRDLWLAQQASPHTRDAYARSLREWRAFLYERFAVRYLWLVETQHCIAWAEYMKTFGSTRNRSPKPLSDRTINLRLAAVSSFYQHMEDVYKMVDGQQLGLFVTSDGYPRKNPFRSRNLKRPEVPQYGESAPIPTQAMQTILRHLANKREKTIAHRRDFALLLTFYRTGYRAGSALSMRWGDIHENVRGTGYVHYWTGKGGKQKKKALPSAVYNAIVAYLNADGRFAPGLDHHIADEDYIWRPIRTRGVQNFANVDELDENRHITQSTANDILRRHLRRYYYHELRAGGLTIPQARSEAKSLALKHSLHKIRHTFAHELDEASGRDLRLVSDALDHSQLQTTMKYTESLREPDDEIGALLAAKFGL